MVDRSCQTLRPLPGIAMQRPGRRVALIGALCVALMVGGCSSEGAAGDDEAEEASTASTPTGVECSVDLQSSDEGPTEIEVWHPWVGVVADTLTAIADEYNASQDAVRVVVQSQGDYEELLAKYQVALGDPELLPDIVIQEVTALRFMVDSASVVPASACIEADPDAAGYYDQVAPAVTAAYTADGQLWPAAFSVAQEVLYLNRDHFSAAGLSPDAPPETLDQLRSTAEAIRDAQIPGVQEPFIGLMDSWFFENQLTGAGQPLVDRDNGRDGLATASELDNDDSVATLSWLGAMHDDGLYRAVPYTDPVATLLAMTGGTSSMLIGTSSAITSVDEAFAGSLDPADIGVPGEQFDAFEVDVAAAPGLTGPGRGRIGGMAWYLVDGDDASVAASWDFVSFSNRRDNQVRWTLEGSYLPISAEARQDPVLLEAYETTRRGRWLAIAASALNEIDPDFPGPVVGPYPELVGGVRSAIEAVVIDGADPESAVQELDEQVQARLTEYADEVRG